MPLTDYKLTEEEISANGVVSLSDTPSADGMSAAQLKQAFDKLSGTTLGTKFNAVLDLLASSAGSDQIGTQGGSISGQISALSASVANKVGEEELNAEVARLEALIASITPGGVAVGRDEDGVYILFTVGEESEKVYVTKAVDFDSHESDTDIHVTLEDKTEWSAKAESGDITNAIESKITYGTSDLTPGESELLTGRLYFVYE